MTARLPRRLVRRWWPKQATGQIFSLYRPDSSLSQLNRLGALARRLLTWLLYWNDVW